MLSNSINFNEVRKLAIQAGKRRPILGCVHIEHGKLLWTDSYYSIVIQGYDENDDVTIDLNTYNCIFDHTRNKYPDIESILNKPIFEKREYRTEIIEGQVVYVYESQGEYHRETMIDHQLLDQVRKLIKDRKFVVDISKVEISETYSIARIIVDPQTKLYFMLKLYPVKGAKRNE